VIAITEFQNVIRPIIDIESVIIFSEVIMVFGMPNNGFIT